jgi:hypothetical protein
MVDFEQTALYGSSSRSFTSGHPNSVAIQVTACSARNIPAPPGFRRQPVHAGAAIHASASVARTSPPCDRRRVRARLTVVIGLVAACGSDVATNVGSGNPTPVTVSGIVATAGSGSALPHLVEHESNPGLGSTMV